MKLALSGLFFMLALIGGIIFAKTGDQFAALGASGFALASIINSLGVLKGYKGEKRQ